jgi:hypothetical protein
MDRADLHAEIAKLRAERDYWKAAHDDLRKAVRGTADILGARLGTMPAETRIIRLLMSGRAYQKQDICAACLKDDTDPKTVSIHICHIRHKVPWLTFISKPGTNNGYSLNPDSIARLKAMVIDYPSPQRNSQCSINSRVPQSASMT